ncbi:MAG: hypothetical protein ACETWG_07465 [Candidatus Neomarinimicrobiota bacterium]
MEERRYPDELENEVEAQEQQPEPGRLMAPRWTQWLNIAGSLAAVTTITILTLEMAFGSIRLGKLAAYALGSCILIGTLLLLIIGYRYALSKIEPGLWRYTFWFISIPFAFLYYLILIFLIYGQFTPFLVKMMEVAFSRAP